MTDRGRFKTLAVAAVLAWLGVFVAAPHLLVLAASFLTRDEAGFVAWPPTLSNYRRLLEPDILSIFSDSIGMALAATALCLALGYPFAYALTRVSPRRRNLFLVLTIIPFWTNSLVRTYAVVALLSAGGAVNAALLALGIIDAPLELLYTPLAVFIGLAYTLLPFMILPLYAAMEKLDPRLLEAARDLGASSARAFLRVTWPLSLPGVVAGSMLVFLPAQCMFYVSDILGGAKSVLIGNFIKTQFLVVRDWPFGAAAGIFLTALMALLLVAYRAAQARFGSRAEP